MNTQDFTLKEIIILANCALILPIAVYLVGNTINNPAGKMEFLLNSLSHVWFVIALNFVFVIYHLALYAHSKFGTTIIKRMTITYFSVLAFSVPILYAHNVAGITFKSSDFLMPLILFTLIKIGMMLANMILTEQKIRGTTK